MAEGKEFLGIDDLCAELGVTSDAIRKLIHESGLPARKVGNKWVVSRLGLHDWLRSGNIDTESGKLEKRKARKASRSAAKGSTKAEAEAD